MEKTFKNPLKKSAGRIPEICSQLLDTINMTLNQDWFYKLSEELPIYSTGDLADIMEFLTIGACDPAAGPCQDMKRLQEHCLSLKNIINNIKIFLLPVIREKLGISCLTGHHHDKTTREFVCNSFIAYAFPVNLRKIESCLEDLHRELELMMVPSGVTQFAKQLH